MTCVSKYLLAVATIASFGSACSGLELSESTEAAPIGGTGGGGGGGGDIYGEEHNGRWMLGLTLDGPPFSSVSAGEYFSVTTGGSKAGAPAGVKFAGSASLTAGGRAGNDAWFDGVILSGGNVDLRLGKPSGDATITHYQIEASVNGGAFELVCADALPLTGVITATGLHVATPDHITFACNDGAAHKCVVFGYPAGAGPGKMWDANQACSRMVRSDYCGDGTSHTRNGTGIAFYDTVGVYPVPADQQIHSNLLTWPPDPTTWHFEAGWVAGSGHVKCLAKARWESLATGNLCAGALKDPRIDSSVQSCDHITPDALIADGAILLSASVYSDLALHRWKRVENGVPIDQIATVQGYFDGTGRDMLRPEQSAGIYEHVAVDGFLLRALPSSVDPGEVTQVSVFRERAAPRRAVVAASDDPLFQDVTIYERLPEGMVFNWNRGETVRFGLYRNTNGDYLSTAGDPPAGYTFVKPIGWVTPAETW